MPVLDTKNSHEAAVVEQALPVGTVLSDNKFTITGHLGAGGFGITYKAQDNVLGRVVVIKECFPEDFCVREGSSVFARSKTHSKPVRSIVEMFMREARSLAKLRHPHIVGVHGAFAENETAYMVLDLIDGPDLLDLLISDASPLSPAQVVNTMNHMLDAIEQVHDIGLLHRDISPDNIIIEKCGTPVLIDFGAARGDSSNRTRAISSLLVVKDGYSPIEFYVSGSEQGPFSDLYALGATFYHILSGQAPVASQARMIEIAGQRPDPCVPLAGRIEGYPQEFLNAIDQAMSIHPKDRLQSAAQWRAMIANSADKKQPEAAAAKAPPKPIVIDPNLERSLSRLVKETNVEVEKAQHKPPAPKKPAPTAPAKAAKPDWVEEFNQESNEIALCAKTGRPLPGGVAVMEAKPTTETPGTDWVKRAAKKQELTRVAQLEAFGIAPEDCELVQDLMRPEPDEAVAPVVTAQAKKVDKSSGPSWKFIFFTGIVVASAVTLLDYI